MNCLILILLAGYIFYEAFKRIAQPAQISGGLIMVVAFIGILINGSIALLFRKNTNDLNIQGAYIKLKPNSLTALQLMVYLLTTTEYKYYNL